MAKELNFTSRALNTLPLQTPRAKFRDAKGPQSRKDLYLHVGAATRVFYWYSKRNGRQVTYRIGEFPATSIAQARKRCAELAAKADAGIDVMDEKRKKRQIGITLSEALIQYLEDATTRAVEPISEATKRNYDRSFENHFSSWMNKAAETITSEMVSDWYKKAVKESVSSANSAVRAARAVYNHQRKIATRQKSELFQYNPFAGLTMAREHARDECLESGDLEEWTRAVNTLQNRTTRDYLLLVLYTGLRRREAAALKWADIDFRRKTLTARGATETGTTKNHTVHTIPLSTYLMDLLESRRSSMHSPDEYVFPSSGKSGYLSEPKKAIQSIEDRCGIRCSVHGLRRTFSNFAAFEAEIPEIARKRLLNHRVDQNDVTAKHYSKLTMERLRQYQQSVTDSILKHSNGQKSTAKLIALEVVV